MSIATALFFMWTPHLTQRNSDSHLKSIFELRYTQAMLVQFAFFSSYLVFALPAGKLVQWRGYEQSMVIGLGVMAVGALLFLPAPAQLPSVCSFAALVVRAAGITCLQVAANPYVTSLGPGMTGASRLNFAASFNSLGSTLGPVFGGLLILGGAQLTRDSRTRCPLPCSRPTVSNRPLQYASTISFTGTHGNGWIAANAAKIRRAPAITFAESGCRTGAGRDACSTGSG